MCKVTFMKHFKKIFIFAFIFLFNFNISAYSEVVEKVAVKGNERISLETIIIYDTGQEEFYIRTVVAKSQKLQPSEMINYCKIV